jgi:predicted metalloprotease with PDZ domain
VRFECVLLASAWLVAGCSHDAVPREVLAEYWYAVTPPAAGSWMLQVEARFERAPSSSLVLPDADAAVRDLVLLDGSDARPLGRQGDAWIAAPCVVRCIVRYAVDLDALASSCRRFDCARRVGDAFIGPASTWMVRPQSNADAIVRIAVPKGDLARFATGLRRDGRGGFILRAHELSESSYTAFGTMRRQRVELTGAALDLALLGPPLTMGDEATIRWIRDGASCVARLFGRFPVDAAVFVIPVGGADGLLFGRVMSLSGASVALLFGMETRAEEVHQDWVVVHELFHLGTPSFVGEGHWLEEGLATYYEPILRERAGWISEADLWRHFRREMPRGLRKSGEAAGLEERDDIDSTYWGGALFALLADVRIRQATGGAHSLDDVIRAALVREGDATHSASVADFVRVGDETTGKNVLAEVYQGFAVSGVPIDLDALWRSLGVMADGDQAVLRDNAPLASVRRGIAAGQDY